MGKSAPAAPDYTAAAEKQGESSKNITEQQTWANRPDQVTPFGTQTWDSNPEYDPVTGQTLNKWTQTTNLDPDSQHALDSQLQLQSGRSDLANSLFPRAQSEFGSAMDWDHFTNAGGTPNLQQTNPEGYQRSIGDTPSYDKAAGDAIYNQWSDRQEPLMKQASSEMDTKLRNQGLKPGDEAYDRAMTNLNNQQGDARTQATYQATIGAGSEASRMQGMDLSAGNFANQATGAANQAQLTAKNQNFNQNLQQSQYQTQQRQQQIAEAMQKRGFSLNEINAIISGQQVGMPSMPGFNQASKSDTVDYSGAAKDQYSAALDAANAKNAGISNVAGLAGTAMMFSDRRLKKNIIEWAINGINGLRMYFFNYKWEKDTDPAHYGYMADEVKKAFPEAVFQINGYDVVDLEAFRG